MVVLLLTWGQAAVWAGEFRVTPIRLEFDGRSKSGAITVINEGQGKITLQVSASQWTQDQDGKDVYTETTDIVYFPKIMTLAGGEQRVIRAGIKGPQPLREKTYRLFIEEIPEAKKPEGNQITIAIRFAPPLFVKPLAESASGVINKFELAKGVATAVVQNTGTVHATITAVTIKGHAVDGGEVFSKEIAGWYLLSGASRPYIAEIPRNICAKLGAILVNVTADKFTLTEKRNVRPEMCSP